MGFKDLVNAFGVSGCEDEVREMIRREIEVYADKLMVDKVGNLIAIKGEGKEMMLGAHMDEVGLMVVGYEKDGKLKFQPVGGIDPRVLLAQRVVIGKERIPGVIGATPPHLTKDRDKVVKVESLSIDIGVRSKAEAENLVSLGEYVSFEPYYHENDQFIFGKAFDDRIGCQILIDLIKKSFPGRIIFLFTTQEELGLRGVRAIKERFHPDLFLAVEATGAADFPSDKEPGRPRLGDGPAITIADRSLIVPQEVVDLLVTAARSNRIPYQFKQPLIGGTDAGEVSTAQTGIKAGVVAVPVRYIHSPVGMVKKSDISNTRKLLEVTIKKFMEE
ncbi:M42 family peptidase [candidate division WOR-3 bacterium]|uniref:M42 family peptidase n=1 Tax=candidate division WOR-3 bacterium TaxID=2052148 RepID=A0A660SGE2_UNCW3|nr:MAG: M42 family peptidase [candidate division WOR-3 bacterium]